MVTLRQQIKVHPEKPVRATTAILAPVGELIYCCSSSKCSVERITLHTKIQKFSSIINPDLKTIHHQLNQLEPKWTESTAVEQPLWTLYCTM